MADIVCIKCKSDNLDVYETDGSIDDGWFIEYVTCLDCDNDFVVRADFTNVKIGDDDDE